MFRVERRSRTAQVGAVLVLLSWLIVLPQAQSATAAGVASRSIAAASRRVTYDPGARHNAILVRNEALARVLGEILFRDTLDVISDLPAVAPVPDAGKPGASSGADTQTSTARVADTARREPSPSTQAARTLLEHRPLTNYRWLIERAFDESVWKGPDSARLERNFPAIWRVAVRRYEASLGATPVLLYVCKPNASGDDFDCRDELQPVAIVPIPVQSSVLVSPDQAVTG